MISTCVGAPVAQWRTSDLESTDPNSSVNGLDCFEDLNEFGYLQRKVFRKVLERSVFRFQKFRV